jgi:hypothetical protein
MRVVVDPTLAGDTVGNTACRIIEISTVLRKQNQWLVEQVFSY